MEKYKATKFNLIYFYSMYSNKIFKLFQTIQYCLQYNWIVCNYWAKNILIVKGLKIVYT